MKVLHHSKLITTFGGGTGVEGDWVSDIKAGIRYAAGYTRGLISGLLGNSNCPCN